MQHHKRGSAFLIFTIILAGIILSTTSPANAQSTGGKKRDEKSEIISFKNRWGFKTNAVDWLLTIPNIGVEFDLGNTIRTKHTLNANFKWNWNTSQTYTPSLLFNVFDARVEWRQYFRTRRRGGTTPNANLWTRLNETVFTTQRKNPRQERAYYWGVYANAASYNLKLGKKGKQGTAYGAGISLGYTAPLYGYRNHYIDIEMGGAIGLLYTSYDTYTHDAESDCYPITSSKGGHLVPFPLITDLRVAFVWRFMSAGDKYKASVYRRVQLRDFARQEVNNRINKIRERVDSINTAVRKQGFSRPDSLLNKEELKQWKLMQKERKAAAEKAADDKLRKHIADSLGIQYSDTLTNEQEKAIRNALKAREEMQKQQEKLFKQQQDSIKSALRDAQKAEKQARKDAEKAAKRAKEASEKQGQNPVSESSAAEGSATEGKSEDSAGQKEKKEKKAKKERKSKKDKQETDNSESTGNSESTESTGKEDNA